MRRSDRNRRDSAKYKKYIHSYGAISRDILDHRSNASKPWLGSRSGEGGLASQAGFAQTFW